MDQSVKVKKLLQMRSLQVVSSLKWLLCFSFSSAEIGFIEASVTHFVGEVTTRKTLPNASGLQETARSQIADVFMLPDRWYKNRLPILVCLVCADKKESIKTYIR